MPTVVCDADTDFIDGASFVFARYEPVVLNDPAGDFAVALLPALNIAVVEAGDFAETAFASDYTFAREDGDLSDVFLGRTRLRPQVFEALAAGESIVVALQRDIFEAADFATTVSGRALPTLIEAGALVSLVAPRNNLTRDIREAADFATLITQAKRAPLLATTADFATAVTPRARAVLTLLEDGDFADLVAVRGAVAALLTEEGDFATLLAPRQTIRALLAAEADLDALALVESGAWTANTDSWAASRYDPYTFDGVVSFAGKLFAVGPAGLAVVGAADDAGAQIDARLDTGLTELKQPRLKLTHALYLGYSSGKPLAATIGVTADGRESQYGYTMPPRVAESFTAGRIPLGRGLRSRYMRVVLENTLGGDFFIDEAALEVDVSTRRI